MGDDDDMQDLKKNMKKMQKDLAELNHNFGDFLDIMIPLLKDDVGQACEHMENELSKKEPKMKPKDPMYG